MRRAHIPRAARHSLQHPRRRPHWGPQQQYRNQAHTRPHSSSRSDRSVERTTHNVELREYLNRSSLSTLCLVQSTSSKLDFSSHWHKPESGVHFSYVQPDTVLTATSYCTPSIFACITGKMGRKPLDGSQQAIN